MSSDLLHPHSKITPVNSEDPSIACTSQDAIKALNDQDGEVPTYGELQTQIQSPSAEGLAVGEGFDGTSIDLAKSPFPIKNDLFEGQIHVLMRDLPGNTYDFAGEKEVLWEIQIQVGGFLCRLVFIAFCSRMLGIEILYSIVYIVVTFIFL